MESHICRDVFLSSGDSQAKRETRSGRQSPARLHSVPAASQGLRLRLLPQPTCHPRDAPGGWSPHSQRCATARPSTPAAACSEQGPTLGSVCLTELLVTDPLKMYQPAVKVFLHSGPVVLPWGVYVAIPSSLQILGWFFKILCCTGSMLSLLVCLFPKSTFSGILCLLQHCRRNIAAPSVCPQWPIAASCLFLQQLLFISYYLIFTISAVVLLFNIGIHHNLSRTWPLLPDLWQQKYSLLHFSVCNVTMKEYYNHQCLLTDFFTCDSGRHSRVSQDWSGHQDVLIWAGACLIDFCCPASNHTFIRSSFYDVFYNIWPCVVSYCLTFHPDLPYMSHKKYLQTYLLKKSFMNILNDFRCYVTVYFCNYLVTQMEY